MRLSPILAQKKAAILKEWNSFTRALHPSSRNTLASRAETERQRLLAVLEATPVGIFLVDTEGRLILSNSETRRIWGEHPTEGTLEDYGVFKGWWADESEHHGQPVKADEWPLSRCLHGEERARDIIEIEPFGQPGVRRTLSLQVAPVRTASGERVGCVVAQVDISDRVRAERALRESEAKFRTMSNAMPQMLWSTLPDGQHDYFNSQWYEFTGRAKGSELVDFWSDMFHPDDREHARTLWQHCLATGEPYELQYRLRHHSGEYRWILGRALPVRDETGKILRWMGSCTDIHAQKMAEEALKEAGERKDEFLAMLAHELRNPLAPISNAAQLLRLASQDNPQIGNYSDILARQVKHLTDLVDDLLDVSRVTRGLIHLDREESDIKEIIRDAIEQARGQIDSMHHTLQVHLPAETAYVFGDKSRLVQVIVNILNNAARYTPDSGKIDLTLSLTAGRIKIAITDNGYGIDPDLQPLIFDLFVQGQRTVDRHQGGLGLGLSLVKTITQLHGGRVTVRSDGAGRGSTFKITLPRLQQRSNRTQHDTYKQPPQAEEPHTMHLMIVDDNPDAAHSLALLLRKKGHYAAVYSTADAALQSPHLAHTDAYILDIGLPGMNGYELAQALRARPDSANAVIIALTGYGQFRDRKQALEAGFDHHFVKPVGCDELLSALHLHHERHLQPMGSGPQDINPRYH